MRLAILLLPACIFLSKAQGGSHPTTGPLTKAENLYRLETCGNSLPDSHTFRGFSSEDHIPMAYGISNRHVVLNINASFASFKYEKAECQNNVIAYELEDTDQMAYYIGSCDFDYPVGFLILDFIPPHPVKISPFCLPRRPLEAGDDVMVLTAQKVEVYRQYLPEQIRTCDAQSPNELCFEEAKNGYTGPVLDPLEERETCVAIAHRNDSDFTYVIPMYQYLEQICAVTGICPPSALEEKLLAGAEEDSREGAYNSYETSAEVESSGEEAIVFGPDEHDTDASVMTHDEQGSDAVPAKAFSSALIPLPIVQNNNTISQSHTARFLKVSASLEVLVAGLVVMALAFYAVICINGCSSRKPSAARVEPGDMA